jgi:cbb3-type cytochrome oxidase subunit 3
LLWMNWSQSRTRKLFAFLTIVLVMLSAICIYFLFQRI